jgi:hypothetical protein
MYFSNAYASNTTRAIILIIFYEFIIWHNKLKLEIILIRYSRFDRDNPFSGSQKSFVRIRRRLLKNSMF